MGGGSATGPFVGFGRLLNGWRFNKVLVVPELVAALRPVLVGVLARADADENSPCGLDLLCDGHEVAVPTDDDDRADVIEAANVFGRVKAQLDVGAVLR